MKTPTILTVTSVSKDRKDKRDNNYRNITVRTPDKTIIAGTEVKVKPRFTSLNAWEKSYLDGKPEFGYDFQEGDHVLGNTVTRDVKPYDIMDTDNPEVVKQEGLTIATVLVLGDDTQPDWESKVKSTFRSKGFILVDDEGNPTIAEYANVKAKVVAVL